MDWQNCEIQMHTPLLPYPTFDIDPTEVHDFPLLHFGNFYPKWTQYKIIYYQFLDILQHRSKSAISIYRMYHQKEEIVVPVTPIAKIWLYDDVDLMGLVDTQSTPIFIDYIQEIIAKEGVKKFQSIDVWTDELCTKLGVNDPRSFGWKCLHLYLRMTQPICQSFIVRSVDKILKFFV
jgi:hypothetical protein